MISDCRFRSRGSVDGRSCRRGNPFLRSFVLCSGLLFVFLLLSPSNSFAERYSVVTASISVSEEFTDNLFLSRDGRESDWITTVTPALYYSLLGQHDEITVTYAPGFAWYYKNPDQNNVRQSASISGYTELGSHTELNVTDTFTQTEDPSSRDESEDQTVATSREPYYANTATAEILHQFGPADTVSLGYTDTFRYSTDPDEEDSKSHVTTIGLEYWFLPHLGTETDLTYTRGEFGGGSSDDFDLWTGTLRLIREFSSQFDAFIQYAHTDMNYRGRTVDYEVYDASVGMEYGMEEDMLAAFSVGYVVWAQADRDEEGRGYATIDFSRTFRRTSVSLGAGSGYQETYFGAENLGFDWYSEVSGSVSRSISRRLSGTISGDYRRDAYAETEDDRTDYTWTGTADLTYEIFTWMMTALTYSHQNRDSSTDENDFTENSVMFTISVTTDPYRFGG
ncbi:MAG: outer membrane beta-barrel protein [Deltaproteobacteria bacterium]|nr:outer membrane beta-barrel protein [Deltaproteobacteria bacterium]